MNTTAELICHLFTKEAGTWQSVSKEPKALYLKVKTRVDYSKEEGYRFKEMVLYASMSYVKVFVRKSWVVASLRPEAEDDCDLDYEEGDSGWDLVGNHDSVWREHVAGFFDRDVTTFDGPHPYYAITLDRAREMGVPVKTPSNPEIRIKK